MHDRYIEYNRQGRSQNSFLIEYMEPLFVFLKSFFRPALFLLTVAWLSSPGISAVHSKPTWAVPEDFGVTDGDADAGEAISAAARSFAGTGGVVQLDCRKQYLIKKMVDLTRSPGVVLRGCLSAPDDPQQPAQNRGNLNALGGILRAADATILIGRNSGVENVIIRQAGLSLPAPDVGRFAGTAIATDPSPGGGQAAIVRNVTVIGAAMCLDASQGGSRIRVDGFYCDGTSGEVFGPSFDSSLITNVHNWPFATAGAGKILRSGTGFEIRGASDDTTIGNIFDLGHKIGFAFSSNGHGIFHIDHIWADQNENTCVLFAGGRGINVASITTYTCGISIDVSRSAEVQVSQAFLVSTRKECVRVDGTLSVSLLHLELCKGTGIRIASLASVIYVGFLHVLTLATPYAISVPSGFTSDRIGIGRFSTDAPKGSSLYEATGPTDPVIVVAGPTVELPPNGGSFYIDGKGQVSQLKGGWGGRTVTLTTTSPAVSVVGGKSINLTNGASFGGRPGAVLVLRWDSRYATWREISRTDP